MASKPLLALALLLAGCTPAPKPTPEVMPAPDHTECRRQFRTLWEAHESLHESFVEMDKANTKLLGVVAKYERIAEKRIAHTPPPRKEIGFTAPAVREAILPGPYEVELGDVGSAQVDRAEIYQEGFKEIRIHYSGGSWCNVYADKDGIHWEECK